MLLRDTRSLLRIIAIITLMILVAGGDFNTPIIPFVLVALSVWLFWSLIVKARSYDR
jgi:hypothetical protein